MKGIILTGGKVDSSLSQLFGEIPTGLIPVNGKPIINYIIQQFFELNIHQIFIAIGYKGDMVSEVIEANFSSKKNIIQLIAVDYNQGPGNSLLSVLEHIDDGPIIVNLADTMLTDLKQHLQQFKGNNVVFTSKALEETERWCTATIDTNGNINQFIEKDVVNDDVELVVGTYLLNDIKQLKDPKQLIKLISTRDLQISDILKLLQEYSPLKAVSTTKWLDFGHIDNYQLSKKRLLEARHFNSLEFDDLLGTITKKSSHTIKFINEVKFQLELPDHIAVLFPRIIKYNLDEKIPSIQMEYYGYPTVAELWLYFCNSFCRSYL